MIAIAIKTMLAQKISIAAISPFLFILLFIPLMTILEAVSIRGRAIYEAVLRVALKPGRIERAGVSSAVHESNGGPAAAKEARQPVRRCNQSPRVGAISGHVFSPSVWASAHGSIGRCLRAEDVTGCVATV